MECICSERSWTRSTGRGNGQDMSDSLDALVEQLFVAERAVRAAHAQLGNANEEALLGCLRTQVVLALKLEDQDEMSLRLVRLAQLLAEFEGGAQVIDLLIDVLGSESPEARYSAGEVLEDFAYSRFKDVALGVERALSRLSGGSPALAELPHLLKEIPEPGVTKLLVRFLEHSDADAVAAAIEAGVAAGDPALLPALDKLLEDARLVQLDDDEDDVQVTIGELAHEAKEIFAHAAPEAAP